MIIKTTFLTILAVIATAQGSENFTAVGPTVGFNDARAYDRRLDEINGAEQRAKAIRQSIKSRGSLDVLPYAELYPYFHAEDCATSSEVKNGVRQLQKWSAQLTQADAGATRDHIMNMMREVALAVDQACDAPFPAKKDLFKVPFSLYRYSHFHIGKGQEPAINLAGRGDDLSLLDPQTSTFWRRPAAISARKLQPGYDRAQVPRFDFRTCTYAGPKTSYGTNAGFKIRCGEDTIKVKLGESFSEPITSRIFWALGFNAAVSDSVPEVMLPYSRRMLREFNMRIPTQSKITLFHYQKLKTFRISPVNDPFAYIKWAVLQDGSRVNGDQLKPFLFYHPLAKYPERDAADYRPEQESRVRYLVFRRASLKYESAAEKRSVGSWDYDAFQHADLREFRGLGLLAAWLQYTDVRSQNTHLLIKTENGHDEIVHEISDSGDGLGKVPALLGRDNGNKANEFGWRFTRPSAGPGVEITHFRTIDHNSGFKKMTLDDARWMARLIAQLTPQQIESALVAGGLSSAEVKLYLAKLESRRDHMLKDLGLGTIAPPLTVATEDKLNYDPQTDGPVAGAPDNGSRIVEGILVGPYTED